MYIKLIAIIAALAMHYNVYCKSISIIETTFKEPIYLLDNNKKTCSVSESLKQCEQFIIINLKEKKYVKNVTILWHKKYPAPCVKILGSIDYLNWSLIKNIKNIKKQPVKNNYIVHKINLKNKVAQFIKILISQDGKIKNNGNNIIKINEIYFNYSEKLKPKLINSSIQSIKKNKATIIWNTDFETLGQIRYGIHPDKISDIHTEYFYTKSHSLLLKNLERGTKYFYQIINQTPDNKYFISKLLTFKTKGIPFPKIEKININKRTHNSITLSIKPNIRTSLVMKYGTDPDKLNKTISIKKLKKKHIINIKGLQPLTKYYCQVTIKDKQKNLFKMKYEFLTVEYNIALNKKAWGTFYNDYIADIFRLKGNIIKRVNDGSFDYKTGMAVSLNPMKSDQFIIIDLGKNKEIEKIITYWRALAYPYLYFIYFSKDSKKWHRYKKMVNLKKAKPKFIQGSGIPMIIGETDIDNIQTRFVKILIPKGTPYYKKYKLYHFLQLMEIKIYGKYK